MKLVQLFEGGKVLKSVGVGRINKEDVPATIQYVSKLAGIPNEDIHPLGSTGKSVSSGDIDLAIDVTKYDPQQLHDKMASMVGSDKASFNKGTKV